jgi:hypothetical protein
MKNQVIEVLNKEHGKKVIEYWKSRGVDTMAMSGSFTREDGEESRYYGVIKNDFDCYTLKLVRRYNAEIIELPSDFTNELTSEQTKKSIDLMSKGNGLEDRPFPKPMLVSMFPFGNSAYNVKTRVVVAAGNGYAVGVDSCESLDDYIKRQKENTLSYTLWKYHQEIPNKVIISKAEIAEKFGVPFDYIKIVD